MNKLLVLIFSVGFAYNLSAQNVHIQLDYSNLRTFYKANILSDLTSGFIWGGSLAVGFDHVQIGVESANGASLQSIFGTTPDTSFQISTDFVGGFVRANFSSIPAYRLGLVTKLGVGYFTDNVTRSIVENAPFIVNFPDKIWGVNAGIGLSGPIKKRFHWEFMYQLAYHQRPDLIFEELIIEKHSAWEHSFKLGISMNLIFGKAKRSADAKIEGRGW